MIYLDTSKGYNKAFYQVKYKGKLSYVAAQYVKYIDPKNTKSLSGNAKNAKWLGSYTDSVSGGTGYVPDLYVYKTTSKKVYYASFVGYRTGVFGDDPFRHVLYKGVATLTSNNKARVNVKGCKGTWYLNGGKITGKADAKKCFSNETFAAVIPEDGRYTRYTPDFD